MKIKAKHDKLIDELISDETYTISDDGTISRNGEELGYTKKGELRNRGKAYRYISYKGAQIKVHRIIYRKFKGVLNKLKVVHHIDGDGLNNNVNNLQLTDQSSNNYFRYYPFMAEVG